VPAARRARAHDGVADVPEIFRAVALPDPTHGRSSPRHRLAIGDRDPGLAIEEWCSMSLLAGDRLSF